MSLLLHYKFDRTDIVRDSSGNEKHLTNINGVRAITDGKYGVVARFAGSSYLTLSNADNRPHGAPRTIKIRHLVSYCVCKRWNYRNCL